MPAFFEKAGLAYLTARRACAAVLEDSSRGAISPVSPVEPARVLGAGECRRQALRRSTVAADAFVSHAVRGWGSLFRTSLVIGSALPARSLFFAARPRATCGHRQALPVVGGSRERFHIRDPCNECAGSRSPTTPWPSVRPHTGGGSHAGGPEVAREYSRFRFPGLRGAPLVEPACASMKNSPDEHFIIDRHPAARTPAPGRWVRHASSIGPAVG